MQTPGRENSKSQGVAMTSDSGRWGLSGIQKRDRDARSARSYTCIFIPEATSGPIRKELRAIADQNCRCRNEQDKEYRSALGLHKVVSQSFRGSVQYYYHFYDSRSKTLP